jgi:hypothetical protein
MDEQHPPAFLVNDDYFGAWAGDGQRNTVPRARHDCNRNINPETNNCHLADQLPTQNSGDICLMMQILENTSARSPWVPKLFQFMLSCQIKSVVKPKVSAFHSYSLITISL